MTDEDEDFGALLERTEATLEKIQSKADEDDLGPTLSLLDDLEDVVDEAEDILSTMDLSELVDAIEWDDLPDAIDLEDLPDAIQEGDASEAVTLRELLDATDLPELWDSFDARGLWREKREFDDELDDVVGDDETERSDDGFDVDAGSMGGDLANRDLDPETIENAVQSQISEAVGEFRETLLDAHDRLRALRERNEDRFDTIRTDSTSRNPTAGVSTVPTNRVGRGGTARHSTVPEETKYSTAPNRKRIYGDRFDAAGGENDD